jgi:zinc and cadmium transporter
MNPDSLLFVYCVFIVAASNAGGRLSDIVHMTHLRTQLLMSGVGGLMLGIAMLHLLPQATNLLGSGSRAGIGGLAGLISMFLLIRVFHTHDHAGPVGRGGSPTYTELPADGETSEHAATHHCDHGHDHGHESHSHSHSAHEHEHEHDEHGHGHGHEQAGAGASRRSKKQFGWAGVFFGLTLHTLIDGVALASSVIADAHHGSRLGLAGIGTFLAIAFHIPLDSFAITSVMGRHGWSLTSQRIAGLLFSLACPLGAFLLYVGATTVFEQSSVLGWGLAVSAGFFICIALADLLPEVAFHDHDRFKLTTALLIGVSIAIAIENLPGHDHRHETPAESAPVGESHTHRY